MFFILFKTRMLSLFSSFFRASSSKRKMTPLTYAGIAVVAVYVLGSLIFSNIAMLKAIGGQLIPAGLASTYFEVIGLILFSLGFVGSIFVAQMQLFQARDNDLLLSMPIKPMAILASRIAMIISLVYIYQVIFVIPAIYVYIKVAGFKLLNCIIFIVLCLILPLMTTSLSSLAGWGTANLSARMRNSRIISVISIFLFIGVYMLISFRMQHYMNVIIQKGNTIIAAIKKVFYPMYLFADAAGEGNIINALIFIALSVAVFLIVCFLIARKFLKITSLGQNVYKKEYKKTQIKVGNKKSALLKKDLSYFTNTIGYLTNAGLGSVFLVVFGVFTIFGRDIINTQLLQSFGEGFSPAMIAALAIGFCGAVNMVTAPAISLESKYMSIIKSLPIASIDVLMTKVKLHLLVTQPFIFVAALLSTFGLKLTPVEFVLIWAETGLLNLLMGFAGLIINLRFPKFDWINETLVVKQSMSTFLTMMVGMGAALLPLFGNMIAAEYLDLQFIMFIFVAIYGIASFVLYRVLKTWGVRVYESY